MKIFCQDHYDKVVAYAKSIGDKTLQSCLERLRKWETDAHCKCEMELYEDCDPYSFLFKQRYDDNTCGTEGGLIYHGNPDKSGSFQIVRAEGW